MISLQNQTEISLQITNIPTVITIIIPKILSNHGWWSGFKKTQSAHQLFLIRPNNVPCFHLLAYKAICLFTVYFNPQTRMSKRCSCTLAGSSSFNYCLCCRLISAFLVCMRLLWETPYLPGKVDYKFQWVHKCSTFARKLNTVSTHHRSSKFSIGTFVGCYVSLKVF